MASEDFEFQLRAQKEFTSQVQQKQQQQQQVGGKQTYVDPNDGTVYEWDPLRKGWFPMVDENFLAAYQSSYGVAEPDTATPSSSSSSVDPSVQGSSAGVLPTEAAAPAKRDVPDSERDDEDKSNSTKKQKPNEKGWFEIDDEHNHNVYVSGLPLDTTMEEFQDMMGKYGIIMEDDNGEPKIKLYKGNDGQLKGDGLCCYLKVESVALALKILHESNMRGQTISVERAHFKPKGEYNPSLKRKKKKGKKKPKQEKLLDWRERKTEGGPAKKKSDRIVIFKGLFNPKQFEEDPTLITDIRDDLRSECEKFGEVKKIIIYDRHPEGVASLAFKEFEPAEACVLQMNKRWYAQRQLDVSVWDGITDYQVEETDQEREQRIDKWEKFISEETPPSSSSSEDRRDTTQQTQDTTKT